MQSSFKNQAHSERRDPYIPCALASAQLVRGVVALNKVCGWAVSQCSPNAAQAVFRGLRVLLTSPIVSNAGILTTTFT